MQGCSRKRITLVERSAIEASLFRWSRMLPLQLRLSNYTVHTQSYEIRPHDFRARQLHVPYLASIIILSRAGSSHNGVCPAAIFAASFLAGIYEDFLARSLVSKLSPTFTTFGFMAGLVLISLRPYPNLWSAAQTDLAVIHASLQELSSRWRSAIGAAKVIQKALDSDQPRHTSQNGPLTSLTREEASLFEELPLELCRLWHPYANEKATQSMQIDFEPAHARQVDQMAEVLGLHNQQAPTLGPGLDFATDDGLFGPSSFEGIPDYFWGDWGLN